MTTLITDLLCFIDTLDTVSPGITIEDDFCTSHITRVSDVFALIDTSRKRDIFTGIHAGTLMYIFRADIFDISLLISCLFQKYSDLLFLFFLRKCEKRGELFSIVFRRVRFIEDSVFFILEVEASIAVLASTTVIEVSTFTRVLHVVGEVYLVAVCSREELIASLRVLGSDTVDTVLGIPYIDTVE